MKAAHWKRIPLGEICKFKYGQMPKKTDIADEGYPIFSGYGIVGFATSYHYEYSEVIVVARGVGGTGDVKFSPPKCFLTNLSIVVQIASPDVDKQFLFYRLNYPSLWELRTGSAQAQITIERLNRHEVDIPPLPTQRKIASILSAYDDLIKNNTRRIAIHEEMAQRLYKEWFVNFRFPGHENAKFVDSPLGKIPEGWKVGRLDDVLVLQRGFDLPIGQRLEGDVPVYAATGIVGTHNEAKVKGPGVLTGRSGSLGTVTYVHEDHWPLNTALWVKEFKKPSPLFAYYTLRSVDFSSFNSGAAVPTLNRNDIHWLPTLLPSDEIIIAFHEIERPIFDAVRTLRKKNEVLRTTRDLLLAKLISGQLDVENLDIDTLEHLVDAKK